MAAQLDITLEQGATFRKRLTWTDKTGAAIDLTGCTAHMQIRLQPHEAVALADLTTSNGGITITGSAGVVDLLLTATQTASLKFDVAQYDLVVFMTDGSVVRLVEGAVTLSRGVTR